MSLVPSFIRNRFAAPPPPAQPKTETKESVPVTTLSGTSIFGNRIEIYNMNPVLQTRNWEYYRSMEQKNPTLAAAMRTRLNLIVRRGWDVIPATQDEADIQIAAFVKAATEHLAGSFDNDLEEILEAVKYGYSISEKVWGPWESPEFGEKYVITALHEKQQENFRFEIDQFGHVTNIIQTQPRRIVHDPSILLVFSFQGKPGNPFGMGIYQQAYWADWFMREGWTFWATHLDKFGSPTAVATTPQSGLSPAERTNLEEVIQTIQQRTGIIIPDGVDLKYLEAVRGGRDSYGAFEDEHRRALITLILGQELTTEVGSSGSRALGDVQRSVLDNIIDADCARLYACLNDQYVKPLVDMNYAGVQKYPVMAPPVKDDTDLSQLALVIKALVDIGQPIGQEWISERFGVPMPEEGEATVSRPAPAPVMIPSNEPENPNSIEEPETKHRSTDGRARMQDDDGEFWREPELFEDGPSLRRLSKDRKSVIAAAEREARPIFRKIRDELVKQVIKDGTLDKADYATELRIDIAPLTDLLTRQTILSNMIGRDSAVREIVKAGGSVPAAKFADDIPPGSVVYEEFKSRVPLTSAAWHSLSQSAKLRAFTIGDEQRAAVIKSVRDRILEGLDNGWGVRQFETAVTADMAAWTDAPLAGASNRLDVIFRNAVMQSINQGRESVFGMEMSDPVVAEMYSAIMDDRTTDLCRSLDGKIQGRAAWRAQSLIPPNHHQCRSILIPIIESQANEIPAERLMRKLPIVNGQTAAPAKGFGGDA